MRPHSQSNSNRHTQFVLLFSNHQKPLRFPVQPRGSRKWTGIRLLQAAFRGGHAKLVG